MVKKRKTIRKRKVKKNEPFAVAERKGGFSLVFGSKSKPRIQKKVFKTKKALKKAATKLFK